MVSSACLLSFNVVGYELDDGVWNVCLCKLVYVKHVCIKCLAHVQSYCYNVMLPRIVEAFCDLVINVVQSSVC